MIKTSHRLLHTAGFVAVLTAASSAISTAAYAQAYPSQDIRLICAFPPGSGADVLVR